MEREGKGGRERERGGKRKSEGERERERDCCYQKGNIYVVWGNAMLTREQSKFLNYNLNS